MCPTADPRPRAPRAVGARPALVVVPLLLLGTIPSGCGAPCAADFECADDQHCALADDDATSGVCLRACEEDLDCGFDFACSARGRCTVGTRPHITWISPGADTLVDETFDVELSVTFIGETLEIGLDRQPGAIGSLCGGFAPQRQSLPGDAVLETTHVVRFPGVAAQGDAFGLEVTAESQPDQRRYARRAFRGPPLDAPLGLTVTFPLPGLVDAPALSVPVAFTVAPAASSVWARVVPSVGPPTPLRLLGEATTRIEGTRHAVGLGPQSLELRVVQTGVERVCHIALDAHEIGPPSVEVALTFTSAEPTDLDLWLFAEPDDDDATICTAESANAPCTTGFARAGVQTFGEERIGLAASDGLYGLAVVPGAVSDPVSAMLRIGREGNHIAWIGPRTLDPSSGLVWLAARVYIVGGALTLEPLEIMVEGLPTSGPATW